LSSRETHGAFPVSAVDSIGTVFHNSTSCYQLVITNVTGRWCFHPAWEFHTAEGVSPALDFYTDPQGRSGGLMIRRGDGKYEHIGTKKYLKLYPGEKIHFLMNDAIHGYLDNRGALLVHWTAGTQCP
jgi:hypothetical protein